MQVTRIKFIFDITYFIKINLYLCFVKQSNKKDMENYIFITNGKETIDVVMLQGYDREECFTELNRLQNSYERNGKFFTYELTDREGNTIFKN